MKKIDLKNIYLIILCIFSILTLIEFVFYLFCNSNKFGLIYLLISFFQIFIYSFMVINYTKSTFNIRASKLILLILLGVFSSFVLNNVGVYIDESYIFLNKTLIIRCYLKGTIYTVLGYVVYLDFKKSQIYSTKIDKIDVK